MADKMFIAVKLVLKSRYAPGDPELIPMYYTASGWLARGYEAAMQFDSEKNARIWLQAEGENKGDYALVPSDGHKFVRGSMPVGSL